MKYIKQLGVILGISFVGEILKEFIPLPIPASIYGLLIMLLALQTGILKIEQIKESAAFLIEIMPFLFIPAAVGLIAVWDSIKSICIPLVLITIITTVFVMAASGHATQFVIRMERRKENDRVSK